MPAGSKTASGKSHMTDTMRGHDMSEMGPTAQHAWEYLAKVEAQLAEWHRQARLRDTRLEEQDATIRRLSDENAALRDMLKAFVDHEVDYMRRNHLGDPMMEPRIKYAHAAIYGTDFPECPDKPVQPPNESYGGITPSDFWRNRVTAGIQTASDAGSWYADVPVTAMLWCATCNTMHLGDCPKAEPPAEGLVKHGKFWLTPEDAKRAKEDKR